MVFPGISSYNLFICYTNFDGFFVNKFEIFVYIYRILYPNIHFMGGLSQVKITASL